MTLLVMMSGAGLGMGKTTLAERLGHELPGATVVFDEAMLFDRPEFARVAEIFRGGEQPSAEELETAYAELATVILGDASSVLVTDASFVDVAEDLGWAIADERALHDFSRRMRVVLDPLAPVVLFLDGDIRKGLRRRETQCGRAWFAGYDEARDGESWEASLDRIEALFRARRERVLRAFEAGGWELAMIDPDRTRDEVAEAAMASIAS